MSATGSNPEDFVIAPDGSINFGEITPDIAKIIDHQAGKIRLNIGESFGEHRGYGVNHILFDHPEINDIPSFVKDVAENFNEVWEAKKAD